MIVTDIVISDAPRFKDQKMAGSIVCGAYSGERIINLCSVGTMDDDHRRMFGNRPEEFIGRVVELGAYECFVGGALRHPFLVRLRVDKMPEECVIDANS
jgi:hypothetical protein